MRAAAVPRTATGVTAHARRPRQQVPSSNAPFDEIEGSRGDHQGDDDTHREPWVTGESGPGVVEIDEQRVMPEIHPRGDPTDVARRGDRETARQDGAL